MQNNNLGFLALEVGGEGVRAVGTSLHPLVTQTRVANFLYLEL